MRSIARRKAARILVFPTDSARFLQKQTRQRIPRIGAVPILIGPTFSNAALAEKMDVIAALQWRAFARAGKSGTIFGPCDRRPRSRVLLDHPEGDPSASLAVRVDSGPSPQWRGHGSDSSLKSTGALRTKS